MSCKSSYRLIIYAYNDRELRKLRNNEQRYSAEKHPKFNASQSKVNKIKSKSLRLIQDKYLVSIIMVVIFPGDIIRKIALYLEWPELLSLCLVSHRCEQALHESFFFQLYRRDISNIRLPKENSRKEYLHIFQHKAYHGNHWRFICARKGYERMVSNISEFSLTDLAAYGHLDILQAAMKDKPQCTLVDDELLSTSNPSIVDYLLTFTVQFPEYVACEAIKKNHTYLFEKLIGRLATWELNYASTIAIEQNKNTLVERLLETGANDYEAGLQAAARKDDLFLMQKMLSLGARDYNTAMVEASASGSCKALDLMIQLGGDAFEACFSTACVFGQNAIINKLVTFGNYNYERGLLTATRHKLLETMTLFVQLGARNLSEAREIAEKIYDHSVIKHIAVLTTLVQRNSI